MITLINGGLLVITSVHCVATNEWMKALVLYPAHPRVTSLEICLHPLGIGQGNANAWSCCPHVPMVCALPALSEHPCSFWSLEVQKCGSQIHHRLETTRYVAKVIKAAKSTCIDFMKQFCHQNVSRQTLDDQCGHRITCDMMQYFAWNLGCINILGTL